MESLIILSYTWFINHFNSVWGTVWFLAMITSVASMMFQWRKIRVSNSAKDFDLSSLLFWLSTSLLWLFFWFHTGVIENIVVSIFGAIYTLYVIYKRISFKDSEIAELKEKEEYSNYLILKEKFEPSLS